MTSELSFTVVIPTFDRADVVGRAIDSVLAQRFDHFTLVVVDDGSTDRTADVLATYDDPRITVVTQPNRGVCAARNAGVAAADDPYVTFLDSDDEALPHWLATFASVIDSTTCDIVSTGIIQVSEDGTRVARLPETPTAPFGRLPGLRLAAGFALTRWLYEEVGGYAEAMRYSENTELWLRLARRHDDTPIAAVKTATLGAVIHLRPNRYKSQRRFDSARYLLDNFEDRLSLDRRLHATYLSVAGVAALRLGLTGTARAHFYESLRRWPLAPKTWVRLLLAVPGRDVGDRSVI